MAAAPTRPTDRVSDVILDSMDFMFAQLMERVAGLTDDEYLWEPVDAPRPLPGVRNEAALSRAMQR